MSDDPKAPEEIWKPLPRRKKLLDGAATDFEYPPQMTVVTFKAGVFKTLGRLIKCLLIVAYYLIWILFNKIRRRDNVEARAVGLRNAFQRVGGTLIKVGQQLSLRADLLPQAYCRELSRLLDEVKPFDVQLATVAISEACGSQLHEIFASFDPEPIGSASIACVFQAQLMDGSDVAIKVRRPGIGEIFSADFRAIGWVARLLEFLTIIRPGFSEGLREGIQDSIMEELDFRREARYQELFRRNAKRRKKRSISAPRVYPQYSGDNVIVMELVTKGLKLSEVLAAVDQPTINAHIVGIMRDLNIKPRLVARRLLWANYAGMIEDPFFHGDPSPGNIFVQRNSRLTFIDFGCCGSFNQSQRRALQHINYHQSQHNAEGMAVASLALLEPLPPIDTDAFTEELERLYLLSLYAMDSKHAKWWERTTAVQWYQFLGAAVEYKLPLPAVVVRMARATLLYDTVAARLDTKVVFYDEYRRYERFATKRRGGEIRKEIKREVSKGLSDRHFMIIDKISRIGNRLVFRLERILDLHPLKFVADIEKATYAVLSLLRMSLAIVFATGLALIGAALARFAWIRPHQLSFDIQLVKGALTNNWYVGVVSLIVLYTLRRIILRLRDKDTDRLGL
jgi:predicted unusual protein kinase regulating ubiquinone biosynthesis (AarF/ABC1/UbiB family)